MSKQYVQFSKKCVIATLVSVNTLALITLGGMIYMGDMSNIASLMQSYFGFAGIVFACYSGNSLGEKIAAKWAEKQIEEPKTEQNENG